VSPNCNNMAIMAKSIAELEDELKHKIAASRNCVARSTRRATLSSGWRSAAIERWIEAFGMEKDANDAWTWAPFAEDAIPKTVNRLLKTGRDLRKEAKGLK
jgi:hypothetical protein